MPVRQPGSTTRSRRLVGLYEAVLRNNLTEEADLLARCLALDLIGPDDFARPGR
jgi:hypothetical protein